MWFKKLIAFYSPPIAPVVAASLIGAGGSLLGGLIGSKGQDNKDARKMMRYEQAINRENIENSYPLMMKSMREGGLNPMLAMGAKPEVMPVHGQTPVNNKALLGKGISEAAQIGAQLANVTANTAKTQVDTEKSKADIDLVNAQTAETQARTPTHGAHIKLTEAQARKIGYEIPNIIEHTHLTGLQTQKVGQEIANLATQNQLTSAQIGEVLSRTNLTTAQIAEVQPRIEKMIAETAKTWSDKGKSDVLGLPGSILDELFSNSAQSSNQSAGAKIVRGGKNAAKGIDFSSFNSPNYRRYKND